jgi:hypothetical protein
MVALKHLLRYVAGTRDFGLAYTPGRTALELVGYSDSDFAGDTDDRRSTIGAIYFLGGSPISWISQKQKRRHVRPSIWPVRLQLDRGSGCGACLKR